MRKFSFGFVLFACVVLCSNGFGATPRSNSRVSLQSQNTVPARSAVVTRGRAATTPTTMSTKKVGARVATTQKVINTGTKVASATENTAVSESCRTQYYGCMDSFCMLDNTSGGRCICSDRNAELDSVLAEIQRLDEQSYAIATTGVERVEMGADADAVIAQANAIAQSFVTDTGSKKTEKRRSLDLANWTSVIDLDDDVNADISLIEGKTGNALHEVVYDLCTNQIISESPECAKDMGMLKLMYAQQIRSDCTAYENSLKQQKNASAQKILAAEAAVREAALEQYRNANKYDLGQCTVEFKKCMISTGGCGSDFSSCAMVSAMNDTNSRYSKSKKSVYSIQGATTTIEISASTYDTLVAKKPLCETVTKSCVAVKDKVWDTFLKEVAPQLKSAELIAEDNIRQNCIGSISSCFQTACKDNIDPNDPDGSYDVCLTRPDTMLNFCKVPLEACGISMKSPETSNIWNFVVARLASMRVDSCTTQVKECLQSDDRCGDDYTQCVGLDLASIKQMCPTEKLVGCQRDGKAASFDDEWLNNLLQGIYLSIDNSMLTECEKIVNEKMIEICGSVSSCSAFDQDTMLGTEGLRLTKDDKGNMVISGLVSFGAVQINKMNDAALAESDTDTGGKFVQYEIDIDGYLDNAQGDSTDLSKMSLDAVSSRISGIVSMLSQDSKIQMCINGRDMSQIRGGTNQRTTARYPYLLNGAMLTIINSGLNKARQNYNTKYNELVASAMQEQSTQIKTVMCSSMAMGKDPVCTSYDSQGNCRAYVPTGSYLEDLFGQPHNDPYSTEYLIAGADIASLANLQAAAANNEYVVTDSKNGSLLGRITTKAVYSADTSVCTITTETTMCDDIENVYDTTTCGGGFSLIGGVGNGCGGGSGGIFSISTKKTTSEYAGSVCNNYKDTETVTQTIKM
ncbi:MAG: hypothetical protein KBS86_01870 [Proteobacteria bacterium]|nr:hypothetical protein [Candidatus Enterousia scatequi]